MSSITRMRMLTVVSLACLCAAPVSWGKTVGIWKDGRSAITDGLLKTIEQAGWQTVILQGKDLSAEDKLAGLDVIYLPGGWNEYWFANFKARRSLVKFTAGGKGLLAGAFRGGYVRTCNRPFFPEVGETYNRVGSPYISAFGDSELAKAIDRPFSLGGWDHMPVKVGPLGKVFAVSGDDPVGVYGDVYGGRYLIFGAFIGTDAKTEPLQGTERQLLLTMLNWLASAPGLSEAEKGKHQARADVDFLRREKIWDWTLNERGPDRGAGLLPTIRNRLAIPLQSRQYTLEYMSQFLAGKALEQCRAAADELREAAARLDANVNAYTAEMTAKIGKMSAQELLADNPLYNLSNAVARIEAAAGKSDDEKKAMKKSAARAESSRMVDVFVDGAAIQEKLFPDQKLKSLVVRADQVLAELRPLVQAAKEAKAARERKLDRAAIPGLIEQGASGDAAIRRDATRELGRIGGPAAEAPLIQALQDADEQVRVNAIIGLGWMQSRKAIPALIALAESQNIPMRRRAVQALGQIGDRDPHAVQALMANVGNPDDVVTENAILSLGWLKAKEAVPVLLKIVGDVGTTNESPRGLTLTALRALGHIGDPAALPALEALAAKSKDFPVEKFGARSNLYSAGGKSLGFQGHAELAVAEIKAGGRSEIGVKQADFLAGKDKFYGLTRRFNALAGRTSIIRDDNFGSDPAALWPYLWEAGMTGIHEAWGAGRETVDKHVSLLKAAGEFDFLWIDVLPRAGLGVEKAGAELVLLKFQNDLAFHGFWSEETYPDVGVPGPEFEAWLMAKHGADFRKKLGIAADVDIRGGQWNTWSDRGPDGKPRYTGAVKAELLQCMSEKLLGNWRESQEWLRGLRKGCAFTYSVSDAQPVKYPGVTGKAGGIIDVNGPETYQAFGRFNSFFMEMHKDGEARPVMCEFYNWYSPSPAHDERGFAQHLMHGECFYSFSLQHIFEQGSYDLWSWDPARWPAMKRIYQKARKIREYLAVPGSAANVGLLSSDLSCVAFDPLNLYMGGLGFRWIQHQSALWTALNQCQIPTDVVWVETLTPEKLKRYKVLVLSDAKIMADDHAKMIGDWVADGGILIASGATSLFNPEAELRNNYRMADLFGVNYAGLAGVADPDKNDTYCWKLGLPTPAQAVTSLDPNDFRQYVHRDIKPVQSLGAYTILAAAQPYVSGIAAGAACEYDMPLGYDKVKPASAEVLAAFANGDPALTVNKAGKGLCYFWTPMYPGLCYVSSAWEMWPNSLAFWPNVRELLGAMVKGGLAYGGATLPVDVTGVSKEVEVTVRQQPERNRWMVHLLDYDPKSASVKGATLTVHPPAGKAVKRCFYPDTDTEVKFTTGAGGITAPLREFGIHDMVVVEWAAP